MFFPFFEITLNSPSFFNFDSIKKCRSIKKRKRLKKYRRNK